MNENKVTRLRAIADSRSKANRERLNEVEEFHGNDTEVEVEQVEEEVHLSGGLNPGNESDIHNPREFVRAMRSRGL